MQRGDVVQEAHDYRFRTEPLDHQREKFLETADHEYFGDFDEQGTGKTKVALDVAAYRYLKGDIDGVLVVAPSGVQRNWVNDEIPVHLPEDVIEASKFHVYQTENPLTQVQRHLLRELIKFKKLAWLAISYDSLMTETGRKVCKQFLTKRRCMFLLDEAHHIKNAGTKRTIRVLAFSKYAVVRRPMTGTPVSNGPFDVWTLFEFMQPNFWWRYRIGTYTAFKSRFGKYRTVTVGEGENAKSWPELIGYKDIPRLREMIKPWSSRVRKAEVLDLPDKVYTQRYFDLSSEQQSMYDQMAETFQVELEDGRYATAALPIVRLLRLQQIACGYLPCDDEEPAHRFPSNPRLELLEATVGDFGQAIIWARFNQDVDQILDLLGDDAVRYDGALDENERERSKRAFKSGDKRWFVSKAVVGGSGLTLNEADCQIFYSNTFSYVDRSQAEDRSHRIGRDRKLLIVDFLGGGCIDWRIVEALRRKEDIASQLTGDQLRDWIQNPGR